METTRYYVDLKLNDNYVKGSGELESTPFMIGAVLRDDSGRPNYERRRYGDMGEDAAVGVIGLGRRWRMQDGRRVGKAYSMLVQIEFYDVGVALIEANKSIIVDVDGNQVRVMYGRGELGGRSIDFEFHPKVEYEVEVERDGEKTTETRFWYPAFIDVGPKLYNPFVYSEKIEEVPLAEPNLRPVPAEEFFPYDD